MALPPLEGVVTLEALEEYLERVRREEALSRLVKRMRATSGPPGFWMNGEYYSNTKPNDEGNNGTPSE